MKNFKAKEFIEQERLLMTTKCMICNEQKPCLDLSYSELKDWDICLDCLQYEGEENETV